MARKQSSKIYFQGKYHNEIYFQGHYHDKMYIGNQLVWGKLAGKQLVKKPYTRISAMVYINGITYALMAIYTSSSYI